MIKKLGNMQIYKGEIRASGHILPDQYVFLNRCGVDNVRDGKKKERMDRTL